MCSRKTKIKLELLRLEPDGKAIVPDIVMTGCTRHCGIRARGIMLRLHERVTYWWPDSVQFDGVHLTILNSQVTKTLRISSM